MLLLLAACSGSKPAGKKDEPPEPPDYAERVRERMEQESERVAFEVRHNPAACACPPYEIRLTGMWHRLRFDTSDEEDPTLVALAQAVKKSEQGKKPESFLIQGQLDDDLTTCGRGTIVVTLSPSAFGPPEVEPPEEPEEDD